MESIASRTLRPIEGEKNLGDVTLVVKTYLLSPLMEWGILAT
jgi:hypothetical protein